MNRYVHIARDGGKSQGELGEKKKIVKINYRKEYRRVFKRMNCRCKLEVSKRTKY